VMLTTRSETQQQVRPVFFKCSVLHSFHKTHRDKAPNNHVLMFYLLKMSIPKCDNRVWRLTLTLRQPLCLINVFTNVNSTLLLRKYNCSVGSIIFVGDILLPQNEHFVCQKTNFLPQSVSINRTWRFGTHM